MNANEISPKANARLKRIKIVSRLVRYVCLALFFFSIIFSFCRSLYWSLPAWHTWAGVMLQIVLCAWYWKLAQLFHYYERGLIFTSETIRCIKILGLLCVINWMITSAWNTFARLFPPSPIPISTLPREVAGHTVKIVESSFRMGFFTFSYGGINLGMLLAGTVIILIAWIMDEGRKIQEEQELTV
ncbi:MAG TPA: DUF2975 domain-containing protein [Verrucomicrobiae bacterium]|jgi:hypothetical protein|nr:DUF2975 domain-containing protein [Verrucomicrobiae bacterium]